MEKTRIKYRQMNPDELGTFIKLNEHKDCSGLSKKFIQTDGGWVLEAISLRFKVHKVEVEDRVKIMILSFGDGIVGQCSKHVDLIAKKNQNLGGHMITWERFVREIYPTGIPVF